MIPFLIETVAFIVTVVVAVLFARGAVEGTLAQAALRTGPALRTAAEVWQQTDRAILAYSLGAAALLVGRFVSLRRRGHHVAAPFLLPAVFVAIAVGFLVQLGFGDPLRATAWPGPGFGQGVLYGGILGGLILALPWDPARVSWRFRNVLLLGMVGVFLALWLFGTGPKGSGTRINLGPIQPIEAIKVAFVAYLAVYLGRRASKLRFQRERAGFFRIPRPRLLLPALLVMVATFLCLFLVKDLGPTLILSLVFLILFYVVTRSPGWVVLALGVTSSLMALLAFFPELSASDTLTTRLHMWTNPWLNGLPNGDQTAAARWAIAAGGLWGQGLGRGLIAALPAGHTDLVLAHLAEELGLVGVTGYLAAMVILGLQALWVAARNRTPERSLLAAGLSVLLLAQWVVIAAGTLGAVPLTGVVVPFLSYGKSSMAAFIGVAALVLKLAEDGEPRETTEELVELRFALRNLAFLTMAAITVAGLGFLGQGVLYRDAISLHGAVTTLGDGTLVHRHDPRIVALARAIPRGEILDRNGLVLAGNQDGERVNPLGDALGTLLGPARGDVLRPTWSLERLYETRLRGYPDNPDGPAAWMARGKGKEEALFVVGTRGEMPQDRERAQALAEARDLDPATVRLLPLPSPDLSVFLPMLQDVERRDPLLQAMAADMESRSVRLTLDANLQAATADVLKKAAARGRAAAAVVLDVDTGQVLARAQAPDFDPSSDAWREKVLQGDKKFLGVYGPWADKTGLRGVLQSGSVFKLVTSLAAVRAGLETQGQNCAITGKRRFSCKLRDEKGPLFTLPTWKEPIHDFHRDPNHGDIEIVKALEVSCNVFFGQLGLELGPEPFKSLVADGLELGWTTSLDPGEPGSRKLASTAFGQGAAAMSVSQAARMVAVVGSGGVYRRCPSTMELGAPCTEKVLVQDSGSLGVILAGMKQAVDAGTARRLTRLEGVRVYGKTGTADSMGIVDEAPYGIRPRSTRENPHSWFVALAERGDLEPCDPSGRGRLAVAVVVPRGGAGATVAGPTALEIIGAANTLHLFDAPGTPEPTPDPGAGAAPAGVP